MVYCTFRYSKHKLIHLSFIVLSFISCQKKDSMSYDCYVGSDNESCVHIDTWKVIGSLTMQQDSFVSRRVISDAEHTAWLDTILNSTKYKFNDTYRPLYGQLDLKELYNIGINDTTKQLDNLVTYLMCRIMSETEKDVFVNVNTKLKYSAYLNGSHISELPLNDFHVMPIHLETGENELIVKTVCQGQDYWFDAKIYDSLSVAKLYMEEHTGHIIMPVITNDSVMLTDKHGLLSDSGIKLLFHDVYGRKVASIDTDGRNIQKQYVKGLKHNHSYLCSLIMMGDTVRQPVMTGTFDETERAFRKLRDSIPMNHPRVSEIDQLLYRVWKLNMLTGKMRDDYWYQFKMPWVTYQLEHTFAHLDGTYGNDEAENNFKFITYRSSLDGCLQRYILVTPNHVYPKRKYPLIVVMRPSSEKRYHLFFSPQIAHQFVVNDMQAVANHYNTFIIMPEARMMLDENLIPFADAEMELALKDVSEHYNIDVNRIFLHANCSGGFRALEFATRHPNIFAAIALYAPMYSVDSRKSSENEVRCLMRKLRHVPILIFGDPADTHSPIDSYVDLIDDCKKYGVPYQLMFRRNSGLGYHGYHRLIVGRDACDFFMRKRKEEIPYWESPAVTKEMTIVDFYSKPFVYVYNSADTSAVYRRLVDSIQTEYETYLYARLPLEVDNGIPKMPLVPDSRVTKKQLEEKNIFLIGTDFTCNTLVEFVKSIEHDNSLQNDNGISLTANENPYKKDRMVLIYKSSLRNSFVHMINYPWIYGKKRKMKKDFTIRVNDGNVK